MKILKLYEVSQPLTCVRWVRVETTSKKEAKELAEQQNFWNETDLEPNGDLDVEIIEEIKGIEKE